MNPLNWLIPAAGALWLYCAPGAWAAGLSHNALMNESFQQFDEKTDTGWRTLQVKDDYQGAAEAILQYQKAHAAELKDWQIRVFGFPPGTLLALAGDTPKAIEWFQRSLATGRSGDPAYIQGFIDFLKGDMAALKAARHSVATTNPGPWQMEDLKEMDEMLAYFAEPFEAVWAALNCNDPGIKTHTPDWMSYFRAADAKYRDLYLRHSIKPGPG